MNKIDVLQVDWDGRGGSLRKADWFAKMSSRASECFTPWPRAREGKYKP